MKTIVTHIYPDLDAITSCWLVKRYYPDWSEADIQFVAAGSTFHDKNPDGDSDIIHVDTGLGKFDHHQTDEFTCATKRVFEFLVNEDCIPQYDRDPLDRLVTHVNEIDHFAEVNFPEPTADRYEFSLYQVIDGLNLISKNGGSEVIGCVFTILDAILQLFKNKIKAEEEITKGYVFTSHWGKTIAFETKNEESVKLALKMGFSLVIRKDPEQGNVRIKTLPKKELSLSKLYEVLKKNDSKATWYLHPSKNMLLNGSTKRPSSVPTVLPLKKVIEIVKRI